MLIRDFYKFESMGECNRDLFASFFKGNYSEQFRSWSGRFDFQAKWTTWARSKQHFHKTNQHAQLQQRDQWVLQSAEALGNLKNPRDLLSHSYKSLEPQKE